MTDVDALRREIEAMLAECRRRLARRRAARLDGADDDESEGVRVPVDRTPPSPQQDAAYVELPAPRYHLDVVGTHVGKVTIETRR